MERKNGREHGEVFTNKNVVEYILDEVGYTPSNDLRDIKILEPSSGKGAFAAEIIKRLFKSSKEYDFSFTDSLKNVYLVESNPIAHKALLVTVEKLIYELTGKKSILSSKTCIQADFLTHEFETTFNCIVGNPPYIRHELISDQKKRHYRSKFPTFKHRSDLYIPFFEQSLRLLKEKGVLSFISSNRWLNNQYGTGLRGLISSKFNLVRLLNIEKSSPFDEDVLAYPCIVTIANSARTGKTWYSENNSKKINFADMVFKEVETPVNASWQNLFLPYDINHAGLRGLAEQGFEIGIGVATGADKIFIRKKVELNGIEKGRLIPLIKASDLRNGKFKWNEQFVINPYENGALCDLEKYPHLKTYLHANQAALLKRHTVLKSPNNWYKTIDKIKPELQYAPKLLLPDLAGSKMLFIDEGEFYPHHNLYYVTGKDTTSLKILASLLMSDFIREQMSKIGIRMNGGLPRFQSQVLKRIKIPNIELINARDKETLVLSYELRDFKTINEIIKKYCTNKGVT